ncbi:type II secretion system protein GspD [Pontimicrobium aquaticum]|uniref:type II secretion system protein GspD n=1 Tax=Pontimicrobium aquaticum TaxID=2565367 RepID=UPI001EF10750|nr:general secretion pathway protein GspD [Pontimicrobium aquaticum]
MNEHYSASMDVHNITLPNFLRAIAEIHKLNINIAPELNNVGIVNNFQEVSVEDLLVFLCKEYRLTIDFTGNIMSFKPYLIPQKPIEKREIPVSFNPKDNMISIDAKEDKLYEVFRRIMDESSKNLVFAQGLENKLLTSYIIEAPFDVAMYKLALANNLYTEKTKDGFWVFEDAIQNNQQLSDANGKPRRILNNRKGDISFTVLDLEKKLLNVDFKNKPISEIIEDIGTELHLEIFTATPLGNAGNVTLNAKSITFDELLVKVFEMQTTISDVNNNQSQSNNRQQNSNTGNNQRLIFNFKKEGNRYFFGTEDQLSIKTVQVVHLLHRSIEMLSDPMGGSINATSSRVYNNFRGSNTSFKNGFGGSNNRSNDNRQNSGGIQNNLFQGDGNKASLLNILPEDIIGNLEIKVDYELNSFYVNGPAPSVERFKKFIKEIDKPVPVVLIEVMIIEAKKSAAIETGVTWGLGNEPTTTSGAMFPEADLTLGANTVNKLIGSFNNFGGFNLGKVGPNFFATIRAMETNGDLKVRSTPRLATLNSHRATFSNGQTSFYAVTERNIYGTDNPQTSEITNYLPIDAELGLTIKPSVSGDGQVLLDISVIQSSFGSRVADDAPPDVISRNFSSIIRMQDQDIAILGGLEEQMKNNSGSGVPFLAKVPLIKYLFSKRKRTASKSKLTILIKPTIIK